MPQPIRSRLTPLPVAIALVLASPLAAWAQEAPNRDTPSPGGLMPSIVKPNPKTAPGQNSKPQTPQPAAPQNAQGGWTIVLLAFRDAPAESDPGSPPSPSSPPTRSKSGRPTDAASSQNAASPGPEAKAQAARARELLAQQAALKGGAVPGAGSLTVQERGRSAVVAVGAFSDPASPQAEAALKAVRELTIDGKQPFAAAFLAPPGTLENVGRRPELNLVTAREQFGEQARFTLQIGAYGRDDIADRQPTEAELKDVRKAAEDAAAALRAEGELAFYYHGPRRSMVTIGVFTDADTQSINSPNRAELNALRKRFPNNLYNGQAIRERVGTAAPRLQRSQLVQIPQEQ